MLKVYRRTLFFGHYNPTHNGQAGFEEWDRHIPEALAQRLLSALNNALHALFKLRILPSEVAHPDALP
jgi:hypothetical protein